MEDVTKGLLGFPIALAVFLGLLRLSGVDIPMWAVLAPLTLLAGALAVAWLVSLVLSVIGLVLLLRDEVRTKDSVDKS